MLPSKLHNNQSINQMKHYKITESSKFNFSNQTTKTNGFGINSREIYKDIFFWNWKFIQIPHWTVSYLHCSLRSKLFDSLWSVYTARSGSCKFKKAATHQTSEWQGAPLPLSTMERFILFRNIQQSVNSMCSYSVGPSDEKHVLIIRPEIIHQAHTCVSSLHMLGNWFGIQ